MTNKRDTLRWLAHTTIGNGVVITAGVLISLAIVFFAASMSQQQAPSTNKVVNQLVDISTTAGAPSVNLTPNDPAYMTTSPTVASAGAQTPVDETTSETTPTTTTPPVTPVETPVDTSPASTPAPTTTAPATPPSPQANPNIIPLVIAWDGLKCPQPESRYVQTRDGAMLLCPASIQP